MTLMLLTSSHRERAQCHHDPWESVVLHTLHWGPTPACTHTSEYTKAIYSNVNTYVAINNLLLIDTRAGWPWWCSLKKHWTEGLHRHIVTIPDPEYQWCQHSNASDGLHIVLSEPRYMYNYTCIVKPILNRDKKDWLLVPLYRIWLSSYIAPIMTVFRTLWWKCEDTPELTMDASAFFL